MIFDKLLIASYMLEIDIIGIIIEINKVLYLNQCVTILTIPHLIVPSGKIENFAPNNVKLHKNGVFNCPLSLIILHGKVCSAAY